MQVFFLKKESHYYHTWSFALKISSNFQLASLSSVVSDAVSVDVFRDRDPNKIHTLLYLFLKYLKKKKIPPHLLFLAKRNLLFVKEKKSFSLSTFEKQGGEGPDY